MKIYQILDLKRYVANTETGTRLLHKLVLETHFAAMTMSNVAYLISRFGKRSPLLYASGVVYERDPERTEVSENWWDIPTILETGSDDCEGLSCFLAAEMRSRAPNSVSPKRHPAATVVLKQTKKRKMWHAIVVDKATGEKWDPSRHLGMGRNR